MHIKNKKGQSTVEYVLLVTAVIAVIIAFVTGGSGKGGLQNQLCSTLNDAAADINAELLTNSHQATSAGNDTGMAPDAALVNVTP